MIIDITGEIASYQPNISDCTHIARLFSSHCSPFVSARDQARKATRLTLDL